jgi:hypothetical protein
MTTKPRDTVDVEAMINKGMVNRLMANLEDILASNSIHPLVSSRLRFQLCMAVYRVHPFLTGSLRLLPMAKSTTTTKELGKRPGKSPMGCLKKANFELLLQWLRLVFYRDSV